MPLIIAPAPGVTQAMRRRVLLTAMREAMHRRTAPMGLDNGYVDGGNTAGICANVAGGAFLNGLGVVNAPLGAGIIPAMTANAGASGTASAGNEGGGAAWQAFDASDTAQWGNTSGDVERLQYLSNATFPTQPNLYSITAPSNPSKAPSEWTVEGYSFSSWQRDGNGAMGSVYGQHFWAPGEKRYYWCSWANDGIALAVRAGNGGGSVAVGGFQIYTVTGAAMTQVFGGAGLGTLTQVNLSSVPSPSKVRVSLWLEGTATNPATDFTIDASRNGTNWSPATCTAIGRCGDSYKSTKTGTFVEVVADVSVQSVGNAAWRITWLTSKLGIVRAHAVEWE